MAFVYKSVRDLDKPIEKENDIITSNRIHKKIKRNKTNNNNKLIKNFSTNIELKRKQSPFGSNQKREFLYLKNDKFCPGPGSYEINDNIIKKSFNKNMISQYSDEYNDYDYYDQTNLRLFISKEERFKNFNNNDNPGPGEYQLTKLPQIKHQPSNKKYEIRKSKSYLVNSPKRMISIPSKGNNYGYIIDKNGEKKLEENPYLLLGNNNNNKEIVGPGSYDVIPKWKKNITDWSKNSQREKEDKESNKINEEIINNIDMLINELKTKNKHKLQNNIKTEPTFSLINSNDPNHIVNYSLKDEKIKINNLKLSNINNNKDNFKNEYLKIDNLSKSNEINHSYLRILNDELYYKNKYNKKSGNDFKYPGPGEYDLPDEYENIANSKQCNNFGSSSSRGLMYPIQKNKIKIGDNNKDKKLKVYSFNEYNVKKNITEKNNDKNNINKKLMNKNKSVKNSLFFLRLKKNNKKIKLDNLCINERKNEKNNFDYINSSFESTDKNRNANIIYNNNSVENFGSLEKRFNEITKKEITPGVGTYSLVKTQENKSNKYQSNSPYNIVIQSINKSNKISDALKNKISNLNHKSPPVGLYSPELKDSIEYNCKKKNQQNTKNIGFNNNEERFFKIDNQKDYSNGIGKYNLIKEDKEIKQQKAPFIFGDERNNILNLMKNKNGNLDYENLGPGSYRYGSYFDWIKKSFNKNFT